jgi:hypothetical protein
MQSGNVLRMNSRRTWRHRESSRNVHNAAIRRALSPSHPCGSVTAGVHGCPPRRGTDQAPHREQGHPGSCTREEQRSQRFTCLVMRGPPAFPLFASWPWPRYNWMLVGSSCYDSIRADSLEGQTVGLRGDHPALPPRTNAETLSILCKGSRMTMAG